mmetsp:Transcript_41758/g.69752  ORF Transcript_41758/g.69752 Transcript_41758/m.69752 type:complete len:173 (+) Transcript_41758:90-608(+)
MLLPRPRCVFKGPMGLVSAVAGQGRTLRAPQSPLLSSKGNTTVRHTGLYHPEVLLHKQSIRVVVVRAQKFEGEPDERVTTSEADKTKRNDDASQISSINSPADFLKRIQDEWEDYQKPRGENEGDLRDGILMGTSLAILVYFSMSLFRVYSQIFKMSGVQTIAEMMSNHNHF